MAAVDCNENHKLLVHYGAVTPINWPQFQDSLSSPVPNIVDFSAA